MTLCKPIPVIEGYTFDYELFSSKKEKWIRTHYSTTNYYQCNIHGTVFNPHEEPCWRCWDSCQKKIIDADDD